MATVWDVDAVAAVRREGPSISIIGCDEQAVGEGVLYRVAQLLGVEKEVQKCNQQLLQVQQEPPPKYLE
jgi:hypothetical protein